MGLAPSTRKKRTARLFLLTILGMVLYYGLFPYPLGREIVARPAWATRLPAGDAPAPAAPAPAAAGTSAAAPFQLGRLFGYVDPGGALLHAEIALFRVTVSTAGFINYTRLGTDWIMVDPRGTRLFSLTGSGYPLLSSDGARVFNVTTDLTGIVELDTGGEALWSRDFPSLMTSISVRGDSLMMGLVNGTVLLLDRQGRTLFEHSPGGSRIPVIYAVAGVDDGSLLASVSGIDPQYLDVYRRNGAGYAVLSRSVLASDFRREVRLSFSPDARFLLVEGERSLGIFDAGSKRLAWVPLSAPVAGFAFPGSGRYAATAAFDGTRAELLVVDPMTGPVFRESFPARELSVGGVDGQLLLGLDGQLLRIDVEAL